MVDIIPKQETFYPLWMKAVWYGSFVLAIFGIAAFAFLFLSENSAEAKLKNIEAELKREKTAEEKTLEDSIFSVQKRIEDYSTLRTQRKGILKVFEFVEQTTLPQTAFGQLGFDPRQNKVVLPGISKDFMSLGQQFEILKQRKEISNLSLFNISIAKEGIGFSIEYTINNI